MSLEGEVALREWIRIMDWSGLYLGGDGEYWYVCRPPRDFKRVRRLLGLPCQSLCGHSLRRPHLTCLKCRIRRVLNGDLPEAFPVGVYLFTYVKGRRMEGAKNWLMKRLLSLAEFLAN